MPPERDLISWSILSAVARYPNHPRLCFTCSSFFLAGVRTNCMIEVARENAGYTPFALVVGRFKQTVASQSIRICQKI
jgi:hypothetical protein